MIIYFKAEGKTVKSQPNRQIKAVCRSYEKFCKGHFESSLESMRLAEEAFGENPSRSSVHVFLV